MRTYIFFLIFLNIGASKALTATFAPTPHQQLFLDTASVESWEKYLPLGIFHGITTNPVLLERSNIPCELSALAKLANIGLNMRAECFMLQTWGGNKDELIKNGINLQEISPKIVVKVPLTKDGIEAAAVLRSMHVRLCMTACYAPHQVLTSCALGAEYCAPYLGRMCDAGKDGIVEIVQMQRIVEAQRSQTRVFVASLRETSQLATLAARGLHTFTFSPQIADGLFGEALTIAAAADFERATSVKRT